MPPLQLEEVFGLHHGQNWFKIACFGHVHRLSQGIASHGGGQWNVGGTSGDADGNNDGRIGVGGSDGGAGKEEAVEGRGVR